MVTGRVNKIYCLSSTSKIANHQRHVGDGIFTRVTFFELYWWQPYVDDLTIAKALNCWWQSYDVKDDLLNSVIICHQHLKIVTKIRHQHRELSRSLQHESCQVILIQNWWWMLKTRFVGDSHEHQLLTLIHKRYH